MKKAITTSFLITSILLVMIFSGCASQVLYGSWQLSETIDANTLEVQNNANDMFSSMLVFTINRDKTVTFLDQEFGTFQKSRNEFTFTYTVEQGEEAKVQTGAWELSGMDLHIWLDEQPVIFHFVRVMKNDE